MPGLRAFFAGAGVAAPAGRGEPDDQTATAWVRADGARRSRKEVSGNIVRIANQLREAGAREGSLIALAIAEPEAFLLAALASWETGAALLPLDPRGAAPGALELQAARAGARFLVRALEPELELDALADARPAGHALPAGIDPRCALLLYTSGSSGSPKGVLLGRDGLAANVEAILDYLPLRPQTPHAITLPLTYSYALVGQALAGLRAGAPLLLLGDLRYPALQLDAMIRLGARALSSVPAQLKLLARAQRESDAKLALDWVASAGAPLDAATVSLLREAFPGATLFNQYGLTEASPRVAAISDRHPAFARGAAGLPLRGIEIWAADEGGARLPAGARGELWLRGPSVMLGYLDDQSSTARVLREGALRTGDAGWLDADGALFVEGRVDGVVKIGGERVGVEGVAEALRAPVGVRDAAVIALPDEALGAKLIAFIEGDAGALEAARGAARTLSLARRPARMVQLDSLPRTANGKLDLRALRARAEEAK